MLKRLHRWIEHRFNIYFGYFRGSNRDMLIIFRIGDGTSWCEFEAGTIWTGSLYFGRVR